MTSGLEFVYKFFDNLLNREDPYNDYLEFDDYYDYNLPSNSGIKYVKIEDNLFVKKCGKFLKILDSDLYKKQFCLRNSSYEDNEDVIFKLKYNLYQVKDKNYVLFPYDVYTILHLESY